MVTLEFARNGGGGIERMILKSRDGNENWNKTDKPIPSPDGVKLKGLIRQWVERIEIS